MLKPPGQCTDDCPCYILHIHGGWDCELLIGRGQFAHFSLPLFD